MHQNFKNLLIKTLFVGICWGGVGWGAFVQVSCSRLNDNTYGAMYQLCGDRSCWASKIRCIECWTHSVQMGDLNWSLIFDERYSVYCETLIRKWVGGLVDKPFNVMLPTHVKMLPKECTLQPNLRRSFLSPSSASKNAFFVGKYPPQRLVG